MCYSKLKIFWTSLKIFTFTVSFLTLIIDIWGTMYESNIHALFLLKKSVIPNISHSKYFIKTNELLKNPSTLKLRDIVCYKCYILASEAFHSLLHVNLNLHFKLKANPYYMRSTNYFIEHVKIV